MMLHVYIKVLYVNQLRVKLYVSWTIIFSTVTVILCLFSSSMSTHQVETLLICKHVTIFQNKTIEFSLLPHDAMLAWYDLGPPFRGSSPVISHEVPGARRPASTCVWA